MGLTPGKSQSQAVQQAKIDAIRTELMALFYQDRGGRKFCGRILRFVRQPEHGAAILLDLFLKHHADYDHKIWLNSVLPLALVACGEKGISKLAEILRENDTRHGKIVGIIKALWIAQSDFPKTKITFPTIPRELDIKWPPELKERARTVLRDFLAESMADSMKAHAVASAMMTFSMAGEELANEFTGSLMSLMGSCALRISADLLEKYCAIVSQDLREEAYHKFFLENPLFVDPLAQKLFSKHRLGDDFITDFVLERLTGDYFVVEIEKPQDRIFNRANDFTAEFIHGLGQILEFQSWIAANIAYAQKKLPKIFQPPGTLIIGRRTDLNESQKVKLLQFQKNSPNVTVCCFDDLLHRTKTVYENLQKR
jgi:hypothetical protein